MILPIFLIVFATTFTNSVLSNNLSSQKNPALPPLHHFEHQRISQQPVIPPAQDHAIPVKAHSPKDFVTSDQQKVSNPQDHVPIPTHSHIQKKSEDIVVDLENPGTTSQPQKQLSKKEIAANVIMGGVAVTGLGILGGGTATGIVGGSIGGTKALEIAEDTYGDLKYGAEPELQVEEQGDA